MKLPERYLRSHPYEFGPYRFKGFAAVVSSAPAVPGEQANGDLNAF